MAGVPDELMKRLHEANERLHQARLRLDGAGTLERADRAKVADELRAAEADLEQITKEIDTALKSPGPTKS